MFLPLVLGDFNTKTKAWFDQDNIATERTVMNYLISQHSLTQIIHESTRWLELSSFCIDLIFTSQDNLVRNSSVDSFLHSNCHHQILFSEYNLKIRYPQPDKHVAWEYDKTNKDLIRKSINAFHWDKKPSKRWVNNHTILFNETLMQITSNFIPKKKMILNHSKPPWFERKIKDLI